MKTRCTVRSLKEWSKRSKKSNFIRIGSSSDYRKSVNCRAKTKYTFNRRESIVLLIVEPKYKSNGWLAFIVVNKIYVNLADVISDNLKQSTRYFSLNYNDMISICCNHRLSLIAHIRNLREEKRKHKCSNQKRKHNPCTVYVQQFL